MGTNYNQWKAMLAITRASLRGIMRSPSTIMFSLFFPVVLIVIFGSINGGGGVSVDVAMEAGGDTTNAIYQTINHVPSLNVVRASPEILEDNLKKGRITALIQVRKQDTAGHRPPYDVHLKTTSASAKDMPVLEAVLRDILAKVNRVNNPNARSYAVITSEEVPGRIYRRIDFVLPGMLGFSLIGAAVFGVAFVFFSLRETLVLKRLFATPIKRGYIVMGESFARILFQMLTAIVLILFGKFAYNFTLFNGWMTFVEMLSMCFLGLLVFMGFGFLISSIAKNQNVIPLYANIFMFPQYFLSGTFFSKSALPAAMQTVIKFLPLTALNDSLRRISFEGAHLSGCLWEIGVLVGWGIIIYAATFKFFKWE